MERYTALGIATVDAMPLVENSVGYITLQVEKIVPRLVEPGN